MSNYPIRRGSVRRQCSYSRTSGMAIQASYFTFLRQLMLSLRTIFTQALASKRECVGGCEVGAKVLTSDFCHPLEIEH